MPRNGATKFGDWGRVGSIVNGLGVRIEYEFGQAARKLAAQIVSRVRGNIENQSYGHAPLSPAYVRWKIKHGLSTKILIATGQYVNSFKAWKEGRNTWHAGVPPGAKHSSGVDMQQLGTWLEFGTRSMPARPHWRVEYMWAEKELLYYGAQAVRRALKR